MAKTILLADDSVTIQKVVELTFMDKDYQIVAVSDGSAALAKLDESIPDLVIADVHMPGVDGYEVCSTVKQRTPKVPVVLLVGTFEPFDAARAKSVGSDGFLKKPFDSEDLLRLVGELTSDAATADEPPVAASEDPAPVFAADTLAADAGDTEAVSEDAASEDATVISSPPDTLESFDAPRIHALPDEPEPAPTGESAAEEDAIPVEASTEADDSADDPGGSSFELVEDDSSETSDIADEGESDQLSAEAADSSAEADTRETPQRTLASDESAEPDHATSAEAVADDDVAEPALAASSSNGHLALADDDVERIAKRVAEIIGDKVLHDVAWEVVPDLAELVIKERIRELESQVE